MIKVYVMESCPDCVEVKQRYSNDPGFELVDIGKQARDLKEFLVLRDTHPAFVKVRERGNIGIPCFIKEDGIVIISLKKFDDSFEPVYAEGAVCNLDGTGC
jgi:glutaredoxin-related protein